MDLFQTTPSRPPLAERVRPRALDQIVGQDHLVQEGSPFRQMLKSQRMPSMILWGPPGVGKTTLARIIAEQADRPFKQLSAIQAGVKDVREVIAHARRFPGTVLFIDEIHRFNKAQQDALLGAVEQGLISLIGATTENPSFEVNAALLSRCQVYVLKPLDADQTRKLLEDAIQRDEFLAKESIVLEETEAIYRLAGGDARKSLGLLEIFADVHEGDDTIVITDEGIQQVAQEHIALYDKSGEQHYDLISAFIKSVRGSNPDGAVYWLARMLHGGEDVKFIARRLIILASEDIGNANPNALLLANACFDSVSKIGMPEARIILSQTTTYLAASPKSNASYLAINEAMTRVKNDPPYPVPLHLRNSPTKLMKDLGYGSNYKYSHDYTAAEGKQAYLPPELEGSTFYHPKDIGSESKLKRFLDERGG